MAQEEQKAEFSKSKQASREKDQSRSKEKPPTKVVVRRLPPTMTEEVFLEQISPMPDHDYFYYTKGELHVGVPTFSRAYINFIKQEDIFTFQDKFDGYVFLDVRGNEFIAVVEFAPYQKIPKHSGPSQKEDKCNTIDKDPLYLDFLQKLENPEEIVLPTAEMYLEQIEQREREWKANGPSKMNTPLVEFIHQRRLEREKYREEKKEERRRKEIDKKKQRDMEKLKKKSGNKKEKDDKKDKSFAKSGKDDDKVAIRVLKNVDRESQEKSGEKEVLLKKFEKPVTESVGLLKKGKDSSRVRDAKVKEVNKERKTKIYSESKEARSQSGRVESKIEQIDEKSDRADRSDGKADRSDGRADRSGTKVDRAESKTNRLQSKTERAEAKIDRIEFEHEGTSDGRGERGTSEVKEDAKNDETQLFSIGETRHVVTEEEDMAHSQKSADQTEEERKREERRIRNKDRPAMQIYRPGAKRIVASKTNEAGAESPAAAKRDLKSSRTFTRSSQKD